MPEGHIRFGILDHRILLSHLPCGRKHLLRPGGQSFTAHRVQHTDELMKAVGVSGGIKRLRLRCYGDVGDIPAS